MSPIPSEVVVLWALPHAQDHAVSTLRLCSILVRLISAHSSRRSPENLMPHLSGSGIVVLGQRMVAKQLFAGKPSFSNQWIALLNGYH